MTEGTTNGRCHTVEIRNGAGRPALIIDTSCDPPVFRLETGEAVAEGTPASPAVEGLLRRLERAGAAGSIVELFDACFGARGDIFLHSSTHGIRLTPSRDIPYTAVTRLDAAGNKIVAEKGVRENAHALLVGEYAVDLAACTICAVSDTAGWDLWNRIGSTLEREHDLQPGGWRSVLEMEEETFRRLGIRITAGEREEGLVVLAADGKETDARHARPSYLLRIEEGGDTVILRGEGEVEGRKFPLSHDPFSLFTEDGRSSLTPPLRARRRWGALVEGCFRSLHAEDRKELDTLTRAALDAGEFLKRNIRSEGRSLILSFSESCGTPCFIPDPVEGQWTLVEIDRRIEALLLETPYRLFGADIFTGASMPGEMQVQEAQLMARLAELHARLTERGFPLLHGSRPVRPERWEFVIDATDSSLDWFELRPEIRCDGETVHEEDAARALASGGVFFRGGSFVILDDASARVLAALAAVSGKRRRTPTVVRIPRLRILDWLQLRSAGVSVLLSPEDSRIFRSLLSFEHIPEVPLPEGLNGILRHYQEDGYRWLAFLYRHRFGACLADDMGLGKTVQALTLLAALREGAIEGHGGGPHLIVVPPTLIFNWEVEISRFYPGFTVTVYRGSGRQAEFSGADIVLTSYGIVQRDIDILAPLRFGVIVFDEAQGVKNMNAATTGACRRLRGEFTLALTGTPVENHLGEFYSLIDLTVPGLLGGYEEFRRVMRNPDEEFLQTLGRRTRPFLLRRTKEMIASELPPKVETDIFLEMSPQQKALYARMAVEAKKAVSRAYGSAPPGQARILALTAILRLRQICLCPTLAGIASKKIPPKVEFLAEQVAELFDEGHSVLVFSQFTGFLDIVEKHLRGAGLACLRLDGSTPVADRKKLVHDFQESDGPSAFLLSLKAGGRGLNLTRATYVFHLDPWWNPAVENQASDRAHRIGQTRSVTITRLIMRHTVEEKMMELKKRKLKLYRALLEGAEGAEGSTLTREDFEFLLG